MEENGIMVVRMTEDYAIDSAEGGYLKHYDLKKGDLYPITMRLNGLVRIDNLNGRELHVPDKKVEILRFS